MKHLRDQALFAAEAYRRSPGRKRPEWRRLSQAQMALDLLARARQDLKEQLDREKAREDLNRDMDEFIRYLDATGWPSGSVPSRTQGRARGRKARWTGRTMSP